MRLADHIAEAMKQENIRYICWGDGFLVDTARDHLKLRNMHPLNILKAACDAMERAPDRFEKFMMRGHDCRARQRLVRAFRLIQSK